MILTHLGAGAFAVVAVVVVAVFAWATFQDACDHRFHKTAADAARAPLPKRPMPRLPAAEEAFLLGDPLDDPLPADDQPGMNQASLAVCEAINNAGLATHRNTRREK